MFYFFQRILAIFYMNIQQFYQNITYAMFLADIARLLQYSKNIVNSFRNILSILPYFNVIILQ